MICSTPTRARKQRRGKMGIKENVKDLAKAALEVADPPKHTKESDFDRLKHDHRQHCNRAKEKMALILTTLRDMANNGVLGAEFRPIVHYAAEAHKELEGAYMVGDEMCDEYKRVMPSAVGEVTKARKKAKESDELKKELEDVIRERVGKTTEA